METAFDWKAFLKPSWKKAAVAALLFVLFVPFITYWDGIMCVRAPCPSDSMGSLLMFILLSPVYSIYSLNFPIALVGAAVCYALACALLGWKKAKQSRGQ